jgi:hypothetical protein
VAFEYLIVDGHSVIFAWPELRELHERRTSLGRDELVKRLRNFQDWTGTRVVVVFDGKGPRTNSTADAGEIQVFYSRAGQSADAVVERLASRYAREFRIMVATDDLLEQETVAASGAETMSCAGLRALLDEVQSR